MRATAAAGRSIHCRTRAAVTRSNAGSGSRSKTSRSSKRSPATSACCSRASRSSDGIAVDPERDAFRADDARDAGRDGAGSAAHVQHPHAGAHQRGEAAMITRQGAAVQDLPVGRVLLRRHRGQSGESGQSLHAAQQALVLPALREDLADVGALERLPLRSGAHDLRNVLPALVLLERLDLAVQAEEVVGQVGVDAEPLEGRRSADAACAPRAAGSVPRRRRRPDRGRAPPCPCARARTAAARGGTRRSPPPADSARGTTR